MTRRKRVTIADVAREAGVSIGTVSRVLNQREGTVAISDETKQRVFQIANQLGYQANPFASALRTKRTGLIGVIIRDIRDPFLNQLAGELQLVAGAREVELLIGHANEDITTAGRQIHRMRSHLFDGLILLGDIPGDVALIEELTRFNIPFVSISRGHQPGTPYIVINEEKGVRLGMDYLCSLGHRRIAFLGKPVSIGLKSRRIAFEAYVHREGLEWQEEYFQACPNNYRAALEAVWSLLALPNPPTALFCATDLIALGAINGALAFGCHLPEELSVIGFDNLRLAEEVSPRLTTIEQPIRLMAETAIATLIELIESQSPHLLNKEYIVEPRLVIRESCASPRLGGLVSRSHSQSPGDLGNENRD